MNLEVSWNIKVCFWGIWRNDMPEFCEFSKKENKSKQKGGEWNKVLILNIMPKWLLKSRDLLDFISWSITTGKDLLESLLQFINSGIPPQIESQKIFSEIAVYTKIRESRNSGIICEKYQEIQSAEIL